MKRVVQYSADRGRVLTRSQLLRALKDTEQMLGYTNDYPTVIIEPRTASGTTGKIKKITFEGQL